MTNPNNTIRTAAVLIAFAVPAACGSSTSTSKPPSTTATTVATTLPSTTAVTAVPTTSVATIAPSTTVAAGPFRSPLYGYEVTSLDWTGRPATVAWNGKFAPGSADSVVDILKGPKAQQAYAYAGPTTATLDEFVATSRALNAAERSCPEIPAVTKRVTIGGEPAIYDELDCGVFALSATVMRAGHVFAFFTFDQPGKEDEMRAWFGSLLQAVTFAVS